MVRSFLFTGLALPFLVGFFLLGGVVYAPAAQAACVWTSANTMTCDTKSEASANCSSHASGWNEIGSCVLVDLGGGINDAFRCGYHAANGTLQNPCGGGYATWHKWLGEELQCPPEGGNQDLTWAAPGATECAENPCDGETMAGGTPTPEEQAAVNAQGYSCSPPEHGNCQMFPVGTDPISGGQLWREHSEGGQCADPAPPDTSPFDANNSDHDPGGSDPDGTDPETPPTTGEPCATASVYSQWCLGDPTTDPDPSEPPVEEGGQYCGNFNGQYICQNPDFVGGDCVNVLGDCQVSAPTGEVSIDLSATNALLQQIRNNTDEISDKLDVDGTNPDFAAEIAAIEAQNAQDESDITTGTHFDKSGADYAFDTSVDSGLGAGWKGTMAGLFVNNSCPDLTMNLPENHGTYSFDVTSNIAPFVSAIFTFFLWGFVAWSGYLIFVKWVFI